MIPDRLLGLAPRALRALQTWRSLAWLRARLAAAQDEQRAAEAPDGDDVFAALREAVG